ncbi:sterol desaturase family protein [uncultured Tateyamaria sp.]|uniref:sterol desaturase family protein n=1 Tax=uncultured Tateyamaria sp. TaxID=455651 RepID=UPI002624231E|nr:sterol desaturase family protein [uncultured Tateyamaria sp.]
MGLITRLLAEFERPRAKRPFGSGWISGSLSVLAGLTGLLIILIRFFPETFTMPDLQVIHDSGATTTALRVILLTGYALALLSVMLCRRKVLGWTGLGLVVLASLLGTAEPQAIGEARQSLYFGLDYFIINIVVMGLLFVPIERVFPNRADQTVLRDEWREDVFYFLVSSLLVQVLTFLAMAPSNAVSGWFDFAGARAVIGQIPFWVQVLIIMAATDFVQYWVHRAFHTVPFLWRFHAIHHSPKQLDWLASGRMHFVEIAVLRGVTAVPMFTLGFDPAAIQTYLLVVYFYSTFIHANLSWHFGWLERFLVTPRFHHWHHGSDRAAIDVNYASHFPLYDFLFGTHHLPDTAWPDSYGVVGDDVPKGYWRQFLHPFRRR